MTLLNSDRHHSHTEEGEEAMSYGSDSTVEQTKETLYTVANVFKQPCPRGMNISSKTLGLWKPLNFNQEREKNASNNQQVI